MKILLFVVACLASLCSAGQLNKPVSILTAGNVLFKTTGANYNNTGVSLHINASFFSTHKLQLLVETSADKFFGDKVYYVSAAGKEINKVILYSIKAGPQLFVTRHVALSATFGQTWHSINAEGFSRDYGLQYGATGFIGRKKRFITRVVMVHNLKTDKISRYVGVGLGYRVY